MTPLLQSGPLPPTVYSPINIYTTIPITIGMFPMQARMVRLLHYPIFILLNKKSLRIQEASMISCMLYTTNQSDLYNLSSLPNSYSGRYWRYELYVYL